MLTVHPQVIIQSHWQRFKVTSAYIDGCRSQKSESTNCFFKKRPKQGIFHTTVERVMRVADRWRDGPLLLDLLPHLLLFIPPSSRTLYFSIQKLSLASITKGSVLRTFSNGRKLKWARSWPGRLKWSPTPVSQCTMCILGTTMALQSKWPCIRYNKKKGWIQGHIQGRRGGYRGIFQGKSRIQSLELTVSS